MSRQKKIYKDYLQFIQQNYPLSFLSKNSENNSDTKLMYGFIIKIVFHLKLLLKLNQKTPEVCHYLKEIEQLLFKVLLIIPINDKYLLDTLLRSIAESELRLILIASPNKRITTEKLERASFSSIKKYVREDSYLFKRRKYFAGLYSTFSTSSKSLHGPIYDITVITYLNEQIRTPIKYAHYKKKFKNILTINLDILQSEMTLSYSDYGIEELNTISTLFSKSEQIKLNYFL